MRAVAVLPRSDCFVEPLSLPRLKQVEIEKLVRDHASIAVPVGVDHVNIDTVVRRRRASVEVLSVYSRRDAAPETALLSSTEILQRVAADASHGTVAVGIYVGSSWGEVVHFVDGAVKQTTGFRWSVATELFERIRALCFASNSESVADRTRQQSDAFVVLSGSENIGHQVLTQLKKEGCLCTLVSEETALHRYASRCHPLFENYYERRRRRSVARTLVPAFLSFLTLVGLGSIELRRSDRHLRDLQEAGRVELAGLQELSVLRDEIETLSAEFSRRRRFGLILPGVVTETLATTLSPVVQLQSVSLDGSQVLLQGVSGTPFLALEDLEARSLFLSADLLSLERTDIQGQVRFSIRLTLDPAEAVREVAW